MSATHIKFVGWQICFDTHFYVHHRCAGSCQWVEREWVRLIELATRRAPNPWRWRDIFYSRCQREADAFHLQWDKFLERGLFFIYIATYLSQCSLVPPRCTQILWDEHLPLCAFVLWRYSYWEKDRAPTGSVIQNLSEWLSTQEDTVCNHVGEREKNSKNM